MKTTLRRCALLLAPLCALLLVLAACGNGGSGDGVTVGPAGGTVTSDDGKLRLIIPPGALGESAQISLTRKDSGSTDPGLLANSTYEVQSPNLTLATPAQLVYALGTLPAPTSTTSASEPGIGTQAQAVTYGACITLVGTICQVELGTGPCLPLFPNFTGIENIPWPTATDPYANKWVMDCVGPPNPPVPALSILAPDGLLLGGLFDPGAGTLTANLSVLRGGFVGTLLDRPTLEASIDKAQIHPTDAFTITAVETGTTHFAKVELYDNGGLATDGTGNANNGTTVTAHDKVGEALAPPYSATIHVSGLSVGKRIYEARALDANGNLITNTVAFVDIIPSGALTVSLAASSNNVTSAGSVTLTATPSGGAAISKVEFFEGATKLGEATASPYTLDVAYAAANNGAHTYHALVTDAAAKTATSNDVSVVVNIAVVGPSYYVDATNGLDTNACTMAAPCRTISKAATGAPAGTTLYLANGTYDAASQGATVTLPDGVMLRATNAGMATVTGIAFTFTGGGGLDGVVVDTGASFTANSTTGAPLLSINGVLWKVLGGLSLGGNVAATMTPGGLAGGIYTAGLPSGSYFIKLAGSSQLLIQGGIIDGNGNGDATTGAAFILAGGTSKLTLDAVTIRSRTSEVISAVGTSSATPVVVTLQNGCVLNALGGLGTSSGGFVVRADANSTLHVTNTQFKNSTAATAIGTYYSFDHTTVDIGAGTVFDNNRMAVYGGAAAVSSTIKITGATVSNHSLYAIDINADPTVSLDVATTTFTGNNIDMSLANLGTVKLRGSTITRTANNNGIVLNGVTGADLGTAASPGNNQLTNTLGTMLFVNTTAAIVVHAEGNTWNPSVQGADAAGHYTAGTTKSAAEAGQNFQIVANVTLTL